MQDAAALKRFGVVARAAEGAVVEAALGRFGTRVGCRVGGERGGRGGWFVVEDVAEVFGGQGVEGGFEDFGPRGSVAGCLGVEVEFQVLEVVLVVDAVGEVVFLAGFTAADEVHFGKAGQVGCCGSKIAKSVTEQRWQAIRGSYHKSLSSACRASGHRSLGQVVSSRPLAFRAS